MANLTSKIIQIAQQLYLGNNYICFIKAEKDEISASQWYLGQTKKSFEFFNRKIFFCQENLIETQTQLSQKTSCNNFVIFLFNFILNFNIF